MYPSPYTIIRTCCWHTYICPFVKNMAMSSQKKGVLVKRPGEIVFILFQKSHHNWIKHQHFQTFSGIHFCSSSVSTTLTGFHVNTFWCVCVCVCQTNWKFHSENRVYSGYRTFFVKTWIWATYDMFLRCTHILFLQNFQANVILSSSAKLYFILKCQNLTFNLYNDRNACVPNSDVLFNYNESPFYVVLN